MRLFLTHFRTPEFLAADDDFQQRLIVQVADAMDDHAPAAREAVRQLEEIALLPSPASSLRRRVDRVRVAIACALN